jgi:predicted DNA-binding transcriptional regulator YafY
VRFATDSLDWSIVALGMVGADFHVEEPAELLDHLRQWVDRLSRAGRPGRAG